MPKVAIVILNWNQPDLTISTIKSLLKINHSGFNYQVILVDNASTDNSVSKIKRFIQSSEVRNLPAGKAGFKLVISPSNLGYAGGNNLGISYAIKNNFSHILVANNDIRVNPNFLEKLLLEIKNKPRSIVAPKIYFEKGYEFHQNRYKKSELGKVLWALGGRIDWQNIYGSNIAIDEVDHGQHDKHLPDPDFISGCCFLVTTKFFKEVGLFDSRYYLYMEDVDLSVRAKKNKYQLIIVPDSIIWHINSATAKAASNLQDYFITRNRLLFAFLYGSFRTKAALFRESLKFILVGRPWQKRGVIDFYLSNFKQGSWK